MGYGVDVGQLWGRYGMGVMGVGWLWGKYGWLRGCHGAGYSSSGVLWGRMLTPSCPTASDRGLAAAWL